jgi:hypothetical protein
MWIFSNSRSPPFLPSKVRLLWATLFNSRSNAKYHKFKLKMSKFFSLLRKIAKEEGPKSRESLDLELPWWPWNSLAVRTTYPWKSLRSGLRCLKSTSQLPLVNLTILKMMCNHMDVSLRTFHQRPKLQPNRMWKPWSSKRLRCNWSNSFQRRRPFRRNKPRLS